MAFQRYAEFSVLAAQYSAVPQAFAGGKNVKTAHRSSFDYQPKQGFLYVRSRMISSRTNDNFDTFPADEIKLAWKTFIGKPVFVNHNNSDHKRARGVVVAAALHEDRNPNGTPDTWVEGLMEIDAVKFPRLAKAIVAGDIDRTSMGTNVEYSDCSFCGNRAATPLQYCKHIAQLKGQRIVRPTASGEKQAVLVSEICHGLSFFENSLLVEDPADPTAYTFGVDTRGVPNLVSVGSKKPYTSGYVAGGEQGNVEFSDLTVTSNTPAWISGTLQNYNLTMNAMKTEAAGPKWENPADHPFYQAHPIHHMNIVNKWDAGKPEEREAGKNWYPNANKVATVLGEGDTKKAAAVISAYSPQSSWPNNLYNASHALKSGVAVGGKGSGFEAMNSHKVKAQRILDGEDPDKVITAPKTSHFYHLIADPVNHGNRVVVDHHAMSVAAGHRISDDDMTKAPMGNHHYYNHARDAYVAAAKHLSEREGYTIHPHQVQAATWLTQQRENAEADRASGHRLDRGRATRLRNATDKWDNYSKETYPGMNASEPGYFGGEANVPHAAARTAGLGTDLFKWLLGPGKHAPETDDENPAGEVHQDEKADPEQLEYLKHELDIANSPNQQIASKAPWHRLGYGERTAPPPVDTLRPERCPICSGDDTFDGENCSVCGYKAPIAPYGDPDLEMARKVDLHKEIQNGAEAPDEIDTDESAAGDDTANGYGGDTNVDQLDNAFNSDDQESDFDGDDPNADPNADPYGDNVEDEEGDQEEDEGGDDSDEVDPNADPSQLGDSDDEDEDDEDSDDDDDDQPNIQDLLKLIVNQDNEESGDFDKAVERQRIPLYSSGAKLGYRTDLLWLNKTAGRPKTCEMCRTDGVHTKATHVYSDSFMGESPRCDRHRRNPATAPPHANERELVNGHEPKPEDYRAATHKPGVWPEGLKKAQKLGYRTDLLWLKGAK